MVWSHLAAAAARRSWTGRRAGGGASSSATASTVAAMVAAASTVSGSAGGGPGVCNCGLQRRSGWAGVSPPGEAGGRPAWGGGGGGGDGQGDGEEAGDEDKGRNDGYGRRMADVLLVEFTVILRTFTFTQKKRRYSVHGSVRQTNRLSYENTPCYQCSLRLALASNPKYASLLFFVFCSASSKPEHPPP